MLCWRGCLQVLVLDRLLEEDGITGDAYGPYDADFVAEERERVAREKASACPCFPWPRMHACGRVCSLQGGGAWFVDIPVTVI